MMIEEILLASNNEHKHREFLRLFPGVRILVPRDVGIELDFEENGETFQANAFGKAMALYRTAKRAVIADDSGLCVDALGGGPGVFSNRYGSGPDGVPLDTPRRNLLLLEKMRGAVNRRAFFVCCIVLVLEELRFFIAQETVAGDIAPAPRGNGGFGYDPLFALPGRGLTMAEVSDREKDDISHRGRAARRILALLKENTWT
jgi:XTP/dITP diphosphohydrolase